VKIAKMFSDHVKLRWQPPVADGGSEITNYIIEKRETSRANWTLVSSNIHGHSTDSNVEKLIEGHEYEFKVSAENQYGVGEAVMTGPIMVKNPYGNIMWLHSFTALLKGDVSSDIMGRDKLGVGLAYNCKIGCRVRLKAVRWGVGLDSTVVR